MAKYKIGDYVKVKNDIEAGKDNVVRDMLQFKNEIGKIISMSTSEYDSTAQYIIDFGSKNSTQWIWKENSLKKATAREIEQIKQEEKQEEERNFTKESF